MSNHLVNEVSPYLLQHAENPVDWYPWGDEAFEKAKNEDKPIFLSIGYSTCHWCHVMAHESFEDGEVAEILNRDFVSVKVDREERPDIDNIYMTVCQAFTGSGGWPASVFMTPDGEPFFAGTYFPKNGIRGMAGFIDLLNIISNKWKKERDALRQSAADISEMLRKQLNQNERADNSERGDLSDDILYRAVEQYKQIFDSEFGGFGRAPKFPTPHNILFLLSFYEKHKENDCLSMAEKTLTQMYRGGLFDHIGYGFCRYSTDRYFLAPHFEKMLYDNALLIIAYCRAYEVTKNDLYLSVAEKTAAYIIFEMTSPDGGYYSAQDADGNGEEGGYYIFDKKEIIELLGADEGEAFCDCYGITERGNFEGKNIPNLLGTDSSGEEFGKSLLKLREYRKKRAMLHTDDKILLFWNSLMISAMCSLYRLTRKPEYLASAIRANEFAEKNLMSGDTLYVSFRSGEKGAKGFLSEYAGYIFALTFLYDATLDESYLKKSRAICKKAIRDFYDDENGGFFLYGDENESLIIRPKETFDGAVPCGNSLMAYNISRLAMYFQDEEFSSTAERQLEFLYSEARENPYAYAMFLTALTEYFDPPKKIIAVLKDKKDLSDIENLIFTESLGTIIRIVEKPTEEYGLINDKTTYYVCKDHACYPPANRL